MERVSQDSTIAWVKFPKPGEQYNHYKGGLYEIITLAKDDKGETVVVYKSILFGSYHTKPLKIWFEEIKTKTLTGDDVITVRFSEK